MSASSVRLTSARLARLKWAVASTAIATGLFGAACAFDLADVVTDGGAGLDGGEAGEGGFSDAPADGASDGSSDGASEGGSDAGVDARLPFPLLGTACGGSKITGLSVANNAIFVTCGTTAWSFSGGASGPLQTAPLAGGTFTPVLDPAPVPVIVDAGPDGGDGGDAGDAGFDAAPVPVVAEALTTNGANLIFHGACGLNRLSAGPVDTLITPISPSVVSAAALSGTKLVFAGLGPDGLATANATASAADNGCLAAPGTTVPLGPTAGPSEGLAVDSSDLYDYACTDATHTPGLYLYNLLSPTGTVPSPLYTGAAGTCGGPIPLGMAVFQGKPYFADGATIYSCKTVGMRMCSSFATEPGNVTLLTSDGTTMYWMAGSLLRHDGPVTVLDTKRTVTALYAAQGVVLWGTSTGEVYKP